MEVGALRVPDCQQDSRSERGEKEKTCFEAVKKRGLGGLRGCGSHGRCFGNGMGASVDSLSITVSFQTKVIETSGILLKYLELWSDSCLVAVELWWARPARRQLDLSALLGRVEQRRAPFGSPHRLCVFVRVSVTQRVSLSCGRSARLLNMSFFGTLS